MLLYALALAVAATVRPDKAYTPLTYPNDGLMSWFRSCDATNPTLVASRLDTAFTALAQQDEALKAASKELLHYFKDRKTNTRAVAPTLHLIGPSGEGKTTLARLVAEAISLKTTPDDQPCALLQYYIPEEGADMSGPLNKKLLEYFKGNPSRVGVVVIDDISKINRKGYDEAHKTHVTGVIRRLVEHEDIPTVGGKAVSLKNAIVILTSDFGNNVILEGVPDGVAEKDMRKHIRAKTQALAKQEELDLSKDHRLATGTTKVVFDALTSHNDFRAIAVRHLERMAAEHGITITYDEQSFAELVYNWYEAIRESEVDNGLVKYGGGRLVQESFIDMQLYIEASAVTSKRLQLHIADGGCVHSWGVAREL